MIKVLLITNPKSGILSHEDSLNNVINKFKELTNCPTLINTSFNVRGEPIVYTPQDAYICFMRTEMDILVLQNQILYKENQINVKMNENWFQEFTLD